MTSVPELHLFLIWSRARGRESEILADLARRFRILDVLDVSWSRDEFARNLTRFYGDALPAGSEKELHCGTDPFLVVVVRDEEARLEVRRTAKGRTRVIDARTLEAKERYREWTGGGHRVHATLEPREFAHDLFLLFGRLPSHYEDAKTWDGTIAPWPHDLLGTHGWTSRDELLTALEIVLGRVALLRPLGDGTQQAAISVDDPWWAAVLANGRPGVEEPHAPVHAVEVAGETMQLEIQGVDAASPPGRRLGEWAPWLRARAIDLVSRLTSRRAGLALVYHRVGDPPGDPRYELVPALGLTEFEAQLRRLRRWYRVVPPSRLLDAARTRKRGRRFPVSLTFDDDLQSHVRLAAPVLRELGLPAGFFVAGPGAGRPDRFWWDDLQSAVDRQTLTPGHLQGIDPGEVGEALGRRPRAIRRLAGAIVSADPAQRHGFASALREPSVHLVERALAAEDIEALAVQGFEIGFHTVDHPPLTSLGDGDLAAALEVGRDALAAIAGRTVRTIAYPHGKADERVAAAARAAGYDVGYAGFSRAVTSADDPLLLPRWEPPFTGRRTFDVAVARSLRG